MILTVRAFELVDEVNGTAEQSVSANDFPTMTSPQLEVVSLAYGASLLLPKESLQSKSLHQARRHKWGIQYKEKKQREERKYNTIITIAHTMTNNKIII